MTEIKARNHASAVSFLTSTILTRKVHGNSYNFSSIQAFWILTSVFFDLGKNCFLAVRVQYDCYTIFCIENVLITCINQMLMSAVPAGIKGIILIGWWILTTLLLNFILFFFFLKDKSGLGISKVFVKSFYVIFILKNPVVKHYFSLTSWWTWEGITIFRFSKMYIFPCKRIGLPNYT